MFQINGKFNTAKIFTDDCDQASISQIYQLLEQDFLKDSKIRFMPDIHAGAGCVIGTTMTITDKIIPNLVGVDIGCGMLTVELGKLDSINFQQLDRNIKQNVPAGRNIRNKPYTLMAELYDMICAPEVDLIRAELSIGTLGGGNHFIEIDKDDEDNYYLVIHSGSRHLGVEVCNYYQNLAYETLNGRSKKDKRLLVERFKEEGRQQEIQKALENLAKNDRVNVPKDLAYLEGDNFKDYLHDMQIAQKFAALNRMMIAQIIMEKMGWRILDIFQTIHNYIDTNNMILRKGSVEAREGQQLLIPINMRDGSLICVGKGNSDWNYSAPHGAGRIMSRSQAKNVLSVNEFKKTMADNHIYTTTADESTIDEAPMAYKSMSSIIQNIYPTVTVQKIIRPVYNFKAGGE